MDIQYKPSKKPQKEKAPKTAKESKKTQEPIQLQAPNKLKVTKQSKNPQAENKDNVGSVQKFKIEKLKKTKEPKVETPKPEKELEIKPEKMEKAEQFKAMDKLQKSLNTKTIIAISVSIVAVVVAVLLFFLLRGNKPEVGRSYLTVTSMPRATYYVNELPDFSGLKLEMTMTNGSKVRVDYRDCEITGFDSSNPIEDQPITVKYQDLQTVFYVTIKNRTQNTPTGEYCDLSFLVEPKKNYNLNEGFDYTVGKLLVHYDNGDTAEVALDDDMVQVTGFKSFEECDTVVRITYVEGDNVHYIEYTIHVRDNNP